MSLCEALRNQSIRDGLTRLFNYRYLEETLEREIQRSIRNHQSHGVIILGLDHFKDSTIPSDTLQATQYCAS